MINMAVETRQRDIRLNDSIEVLVASMTDAHSDVRSRVASRLKELEFRTVRDLSVKSVQFLQRELGLEAARHVSDTLGKYYAVILTDVQARQRAPGDPPHMDAGYNGAPRFE